MIDRLAAAVLSPLTSLAVSLACAGGLVWAHAAGERAWGMVCGVGMTTFSITAVALAGRPRHGDHNPPHNPPPVV